MMLINGDCMEYMRGCEDNAFDLIATDPPYFRVKSEKWDTQWSDSREFLKWMSGLAIEFRRILKPNGSLYVFASPQMAARVECVIAEQFNVLNSIVWRKGVQNKRAISQVNKTDKESLRSYAPVTERVVFAEHYSADNMALGESGYEDKCAELRGFIFEPLRAYLRGEFARAGMLTSKGLRMANVACGFSDCAGGMASRHYFSSSQWSLPTKTHYKALRELLNKDGGEYLAREYEDLRREYEDLRREYEDLRRPFNCHSKAQWTDVWEFDPVKYTPGKHPCEKPQTLLRHILDVSLKRPGKVFDPFMGGGSMAVAAYRHGCEFVGLEIDEHYYAAACSRFKAETAQEDMFGHDRS